MFDYKKILPAFIAGGNPADDTLNKYQYEIDNWLTWCSDNDFDPLKITEYDARLYLRYLTNRRYADASIALKVSAVKMFYYVTTKLKLVETNPFADIKTKAPTYDDADFDFLKPSELKEICDSLRSSTDPVSARNLAIVMLMAVEGLRTVEVHRMSDEDFKERTNSILIHGKGRDAYIYPCEDTLNIIERYRSVRPEPIADGAGTPTFVGLARKFYGHRITRNGIRWAINGILTAANKKKSGEACHMLRHTCGTNLYAATKDLRLVQETLRQKNPSVTARYAHVSERITDRKTSTISPFKSNEASNENDGN